MIEKSQPPLVTKSRTITVLFLSVLFFFIMREILVPHVPSQDPTAVLVVSSITSFCMSGVFWIAANMLLVTWVDFNQKKEK